jgi:hypothetical protein
MPTPNEPAPDETPEGKTVEARNELIREIMAEASED